MEKTTQYGERRLPIIKRQLIMERQPCMEKATKYGNDNQIWKIQPSMEKTTK